MRARSLLPVPPALAAAFVGLLLLAAFALGGPYPAATVFIFPILALTSIAIGLRLPVWWYFALFPLLIIMPPPAFIRWFDVVPVGLGILALVLTVQSPSRQAWDVRVPGLLVLAVLTVPLLALPFVARIESWAAVYKGLLTACMLFVGLRRVVPRERSEILLLAFAIIGATIAFELVGRTSLAGGLVAARPQFRTFYTNLGWGNSNYIGAVLVLCIGATIVLWMLHRSVPGRLAMAASLVLQLQALVLAQSRGATVALVLIAIILFVSGGGVQALVISALGATGLAVGLASPAGQVLVRRFVDPQESASWFIRIEIWHTVWLRFLGKPWTGIGLNQGQFQGDEVGIADAHNVVLQALMEQGILGGILIIAILVGAICLAVRAWPPGVSERALPRVRRAILAVVLGVIVNAMIEPTLNGFEMLMLFAWFLGWLALQDPHGTPALSSGAA